MSGSFHFEPVNLNFDRPPHSISAQETDFWPNEWTPCRFPERPFNIHTALHDCCRACLIAAEANNINCLAEMRARLETWGEAAP